MDNIINVEIRNVFGVDKVYPIDARALLFAELAGTKTLTPTACDIIKELGYTIHATKPTSYMEAIL